MSAKSFTGVPEDPADMFSIGYDYYVGKNVRQSFDEAFKWFSKAAEQDDPNAHCLLGKMYAGGYGVKQSYPLAITHPLSMAKRSKPSHPHS